MATVRIFCRRLLATLPTLLILGRTSGAFKPSYETPFNINLDLGCPVLSPSPNPLHGNGTRCVNGDAAPILNETETALWRAKWLHPRNLDKFALARSNAKSCGVNCASAYCYYSMATFDYVCGNATRDHQKATIALNHLEEHGKKYQELPAGRICFGKDYGLPHNPIRITLRDIQISEWYDKHFFHHSKLREELGKACESKRCEIVKGRAGFICAKHTVSMSIRTVACIRLMLLGFGVFLNYA